MKKILTCLFFILIFASLFINVYAAEEFEYELTYKVDSTYVIEIPSEINFVDGDRAETQISISDVYVPENKTINISISSETSTGVVYWLTNNNNSENVIPYMIYIDSKVAENNSTFMKVYNGDTTDGAITKSVLLALMGDAPTSGNYSDILTFKINLGDTEKIGNTASLSGQVFELKKDVTDFSSNETFSSVVLLGGINISAKSPVDGTNLTTKAQWGFEITIDGNTQYFKSPAQPFGKITINGVTYASTDKSLFGQDVNGLFYHQLWANKEDIKNSIIREYIDFDGNLTTTEDTIFGPMKMFE